MYAVYQMDALNNPNRQLTVVVKNRKHGFVLLEAAIRVLRRRASMTERRYWEFRIAKDGGGNTRLAAEYHQDASMAEGKAANSV